VYDAAPPQLQDLAVALLEFHEVSVDPFLHKAKVLLNGSTNN